MASRPLARRLALLSGLVLTLGGCDLPQRYQAAGDVRAFFQAVQAGDEAAFEAHIDRPALRRELRGQVDQAAAGAGLGAGTLEALLGAGRSDALVDQLISPSSFRVAWRRSGVSTDRVPSTPELAALLRMNGPDEACLHDLKGGRCVLVFRREGGTFKLAEVATGAMRMQPLGTE